mgnify:CR=1 FL=1
MILKRGMGILLLLFLSERAYGVCTYAANTGDSYVVMGQGYGMIIFNLGNSPFPGSNEPITSVTFLFPSSTYKGIACFPYFYPWTCTPLESGDYSGINCVYTTPGLNPGQYDIFEIYVSGPNFGAIPSFSADVTDSVTLQVKGSLSTCSPFPGMSPPSWRRHALDNGLMLWATPLRVKSGDIILVEMEVANRSTSTQNGITPVLTPNGPVEHISGPEPSSLNLSPNTYGRFVWQYRATGDGNIWFKGYAVNSSASSISNPSDTVRAYELSTYTYVKSPVRLNEKTEIWVMVYRYGEVSAGMLFPSVSISGNLTGSLSSPSPVSYPAVPTGGAISFLYEYTPSSGSQGTFTGGAAAFSPSTINALSSDDDLIISGTQYITAEPDITLPGDNLPITWTVSFPTTVCIFYVHHNPEFTYITGSASGGWNGYSWNVYESPEGVTFVAPSYPLPDLCLPAGETGHFTLRYNIPPVPSETVYLLPAYLPEYEVSGLDSIIVLNKKLSISKNFSTLLADGNSRGEITVKLTDYLGNPLEERGLAFFTNRGMLLSHSGITDSNGEVKINIVSPFSPSSLTGTVLAAYKYDPRNWGMEEGFVVPITVPFNGYSGGNILYVGGTLFPRVCTKGTTLSFSADFINLGDSPKTLTTPTTFSFTDGSHTYQAGITGSISFNPGERKSISFAYAHVDPNFVDGLYMPVFNYTGTDGDPERTVWDNVLVGGPTPVEVAYFYAFIKNEETWFFWGVYSGEINGFNIMKEIRGTKEYITHETIPFTGYMDYYYVTEVLDKSASYYLEVITPDRIYLYGPAIISDKNDEKFVLTFNYTDDEKSIKGVFSCAVKGKANYGILFVFSFLLFLRRRFVL